MKKDKSGVPDRAGRRKGGKTVPALLNLCGTLILVLVILSCVPVTLPRAFGYDIYNVVSGSMAPEIPVGSILYVEEAKPEEIKEKEIIAYTSGESVVTHRVIANHQVEGEFTTKGDANAKEDLQAIPYGQLIGRVVKHYPVLGQLMSLYTSTIGKAYVICFAACGAMLNILAGRLRKREK